MKHPSKLVIQRWRPGRGGGAERICTERRISLGLKQLESNPWESLHEKFPVGAIVEGKVRNLTDFGAFIEIEDGIDGLVHVSNLSWTKRVKHPSEVLKKGDKVKAIVLAIEPDQRRLSLGVKQLQPDVWESFFEQHRVGDVITARSCVWPASAHSSRSPMGSKACATTPRRSTRTASPSRWKPARSTTSRSSR